MSAGIRADSEGGKAHIQVNGVDSVTAFLGGGLRFIPRANAPDSPLAGDVYFSSADSKLKCFDGTAWNDLF
jgi:hypothetical protein